MNVSEQTQVIPPPLDENMRAELALTLEGEVFTDLATRMCYATDASIYQQLPLAVIYPKHGTDCVAIMEFSQRHSLPIIPRAAGTSLAGQCVGTGLVVDVTRHMHTILEVDQDSMRVRAQPGIIMQAMNEALKNHGLCVPVDPSTADRCAIGGMLGNNAWGAHYLRDGSTRDHVVAVDAVLSDGSRVEFGPANAELLGFKRELNTREGEIYRTLHGLVDQHRTLILDKYPDPDKVPSNMGYPLDLLAHGQPWVEDGPCFNLAPFLCGSEGTLALITDITFRLSPIPEPRVMVWGQFQLLYDAFEAVPEILKHNPVALELLDRYVMDAAFEHRLGHMQASWIKGNPEAVLMIEFEDKPSASATEQAQALITAISSRTSMHSFSILDHGHAIRAWKLRRAGLGLLMGNASPIKAVTAVEDCAVPPERLPAFIERVQDLMLRHHCDFVFYGSVGAGLVHLRPWLNISSPEGRTRMLTIQTDMAGIVAEFGGSISAKHGDGRLRSHLLDTVLGYEIHPLLLQVKAIFDPHNLLNPGKILNAPPPGQNLRNRRQPSLMQDEFNWGSDQDMRGAVGRCNGAAVCLKQPGRGVMCPSYMATKDERHTTRGRANVLRQILDSPDPIPALSSAAVTQAMDLCISCKGCKAECPASVDMARIKAQVLQHRNRQHGVPLRSRLIASLPKLAQWGMQAPFLANAILASGLMRRAFGLTPKYSLPKLARQTWLDWWQLRPTAKTEQKSRVLLVVDPFTNYLEPEIGKAAVEFFEWAGYLVELTPCLSSGRLQISQGLLTDARHTMTQMIEELYPAAAEGVPIIGIEPAELLTLHDEAIDLVDREDLRNRARTLAAGTWLFEEWVCRMERNQGLVLPEQQRQEQNILVHTHCHQKALSEPQAATDCLKLIPGAKVEAINSGCCGMAGAFGYELEHADIAREIGELSLLPAVREATTDTTIVACGTSCRYQIKIGTGRQAQHPAEVLRAALP